MSNFTDINGGSHLGSRLGWNKPQKLTIWLPRKIKGFNQENFPKKLKLWGFFVSENSNRPLELFHEGYPFVFKIFSGTQGMFQEFVDDFLWKIAIECRNHVKSSLFWAVFHRTAAFDSCSKKLLRFHGKKAARWAWAAGDLHPLWWKMEVNIPYVSINALSAWEMWIKRHSKVILCLPSRNSCLIFQDTLSEGWYI